MPKKKLKFDNKRVTQLCKEYMKHPKDIEQRNKIMLAIRPLIDAALIKRGVSQELKDDLRQECSLKVLKNIKNFNPERGSTFAFFWTVICTGIATHKKRWTSTSVSLTPGDDEEGGLEVSGGEVYQTPENQHILNRIGEALTKAFQSSEFSTLVGKKSKKASIIIGKAIQSGEFFEDKQVTMRKLRKLGLKKSDIQYYVSYALINVRKQLLGVKGDLSELSDRASERHVAPQFSRSVQ